MATRADKQSRWERVESYWTVMTASRARGLLPAGIDMAYLTKIEADEHVQLRGLVQQLKFLES